MFLTVLPSKTTVPPCPTTTPPTNHIIHGLNTRRRCPCVRPHSSGKDIRLRDRGRISGGGYGNAPGSDRKRRLLGAGGVKVSSATRGFLGVVPGNARRLPPETYAATGFGRPGAT